MTYQLKGGEEIRGGKLYGWTGYDCLYCGGVGEDFSDTNDPSTTCSKCAGTGERWGLMPTQPENLETQT